ncbi:remorin family protein [Actinidia rufa]|uniref:Remorin family protein n=1 Tax=Actinidia rufa TaxID=165716 RepID=A0A7J0G7W8_9ERIC|nr:remorin family protein [Actinidia rufa]
MAKEESKKLEALEPAPAEPQPPPPAASSQAKVNATDNVVQEISMIPHPPPPEEETQDLLVKKTSRGSLDRDIALAQIDKEKRLSFIKALEESEKSKVENK